MTGHVVFSTSMKRCKHNTVKLILQQFQINKLLIDEMNKCPRQRGRFCLNTEVKFDVLLFVVFFICISQGVRISNGVVPKFLQLSVSIGI